MNKAYRLPEPSCQKTPAVLVSHLQQTWCRHGEQELHRFRSRLCSLDPQQQEAVWGVLQSLVNAVLFPIVQYVQTVPPDEQEAATRALALLFGLASEDANGPQT